MGINGKSLYQYTENLYISIREIYQYTGNLYISIREIFISVYGKSLYQYTGNLYISTVYSVAQQSMSKRNK
jgi:hypothetical protein